MALTTPLSSPGVHIREIDLTGVAPNVQSTTGAFVGDFRWGPSDTPVLISNENELVSIFGSPASKPSDAQDFWSAAYFLKYSGSLYVVRGNSSTVHAATKRPLMELDSDGTTENPVLDSDGSVVYIDGTPSFKAKYSGKLGNALSVHICPASPTNAGWDNWSATIGADKRKVKSLFDEKPGTSDWAAQHGGENDEVHVAVIDRTGEFTGTPGTVLELYPFASVAPNALNPQGGPLYIKDWVNSSSSYIEFLEFSGDPADLPWGLSAGQETSLDTPKNYASEFAGYAHFVEASETTMGVADYSHFEDVESIEVDFLISPAGDKDTVENLVAIAEGRKDCVVVASMELSDVTSTSATWSQDLVDKYGEYTSSSYLFMDSNHIKVYDKYNDQYVTIPAASSTAGIMAAADLVSAPWFSPAGQRRGNYLGVTDVARSYNKSERDTLYKASINPITAMPGAGVMLFGDKTFLRRPSAFDRINVRRLLLVLERSISQAGKNVMFEFNDEFTRAEFVNIVEPLLREVQGRRGITEFRVVCDETNNTPAVIDRNEFVASIFIKPARSINFVQLNFVAVRTGVEFEEVIGTV